MGNDLSRIWWRDALFASVVGAVTLAGYLYTLAPTVTAGDSGELVAAAHCLGVPHPPGYPLWTIMAHVFTRGVPFQDVACRVNLMSAMLSSASVAFVYLVARGMGLSWLASAFGALALAFSRTLWSQSIIAEVYALNTFLVSGMLLCAVFWYTRRQTRWFLFFCLFAGLSTTNHLSVLPILCAFSLFWLCEMVAGRLSRKDAVVGVVVVLLMQGIYLYLPWSASRSPAMNWGNPATLDDALFHILRKQYPSEITKFPRSLGVTLFQFLSYGRLVLSQFSPWLCVLLPAGLLCCWRFSRRIALLFLGVFLCSSAVYVLVLNLPPEREQVEASEVFFIPSFMVLAVFLAGGFDTARSILRELLARLSGRGAVRLLASTVLAATLIGFLFCSNVGKVTLRGCYLVRDYGRNLLSGLEPDSILFPGGDTRTFSCIYMQVVEGYRTDVKLADRYSYIDRALYEDMPGEHSEFPVGREQDEIQRWIIANASTPVYVDTKLQMDGLPHMKIIPAGMFYRVVREDYPADIDTAPWLTYRWQDDVERWRGDYGNDMIHANRAFFRAVTDFQLGSRDDAVEWVQKAARHGSGIKEVINNLGSLCAENGETALAVELFHAALEVSGRYLSPVRNLALLYKGVGDTERAAGFFDVWTKMDPGDAVPHRELGFILLHSGEIAGAKSAFERSLEIDESQADLREILGRLGV